MQQQLDLLTQSKQRHQKQSSENALQGASTESIVRPIVQIGRAEGGTVPSCPKCGSADTRKEGFGKLRADGTKAVRVRCINCGKFSMVG
ncbi:MAG: hypothetical protein LH702_28940 [Phormidesmis sp. CAN_BIN44]|nr:hypothetical protein [Phormidesmis sp. CAN_BIN44]